jgi:hypothetical protein
VGLTWDLFVKCTAQSWWLQGSIVDPVRIPAKLVPELFVGMRIFVEGGSEIGRAAPLLEPPMGVAVKGAI